jgi:hypothetical protein
MLHMDSCVTKAIMQVAMYVSVSSGMRINWLLTKNNRNGLNEETTHGMNGNPVRISYDNI